MSFSEQVWSSFTEDGPLTLAMKKFVKPRLSTDMLGKHIDRRRV